MSTLINNSIGGAIKGLNLMEKGMGLVPLTIVKEESMLGIGNKTK